MEETPGDRRSQSWRAVRRAKQVRYRPSLSHSGALLCAVLTATLLGLVNPPTAGAADGGAEAAFVARINSIRASQGLGPVQAYGELTGIARGWSDQMAANGGISHNPSFSGQVSANWSKLGENVGVGYSVDDLMSAFVNSPAHYRNITDPAFNYIGVGVSYGDDGRMYTTHDFMSMGPVSALRETSVVFAALLGRLFLKESLTARRLSACSVIAFGAYCLGHPA